MTTDLLTVGAAILMAVIGVRLLLNAYQAGLWPCWCDRCHRWTQERHSRRTQLTLGNWVRLCDNCYRKVYGETP